MCNWIACPSIAWIVIGVWGARAPSGCGAISARPSRGRHHGTAVREERAASSWMVYHHFTPAQRRLERKRHYKHPGQGPLEVAGSVLEGVSYLDALQI